MHGWQGNSRARKFKGMQGPQGNSITHDTWRFGGVAPERLRKFRFFKKKFPKSLGILGTI